jgi:hypothetical protein
MAEPPRPYWVLYVSLSRLGPSVTVLAYSSACRDRTWSMKVKSILIPPNGAEKLASRLEPPEYGTVIALSIALGNPCDR